MAEEYSLRLVYKAEFHEVYQEHHEHPEFGQLLQRMHVVNARGESQMDEEQWDAASKYLPFAMMSSLINFFKTFISLLHSKNNNVFFFCFLFAFCFVVAG